MSWFRRRVPQDVAPVYTAEAADQRPDLPTTFTGASTRGPRAIQDAGPYEFWADDGQHVYLHDMDFQWFRYAATPSPELRIRFDWGGQSVSESFAGPVVEFTFGDVRIHEWDEEPLDEQDREHLGQVGAFTIDSNIFTFQTYGLSLSFTAQECHVATGTDL